MEILVRDDLSPHTLYSSCPLTVPDQPAPRCILGIHREPVSGPLPTTKICSLHLTGHTLDTVCVNVCKTNTGRKIASLLWLVEAKIRHFKNSIIWFQTFTYGLNSSQLNGERRDAAVLSSRQTDSRRRACVCAGGTCGWRYESTFHTGTSSLRSGSAGERAGSSGLQTLGYSGGMRRGVHLKKKEIILFLVYIHIYNFYSLTLNAIQEI